MTAQERLDLGRSYYNEDKFDEAIKALSSIRREEAAPEIYAQALLGIGAAYQALGKLKKAIKAWSKVRHGDDPKAYAGAQLGLGLAYYTRGKLDDAIAAWSNIHREKIAPETYAKAQLNLGVAYKDQGKLDDAIAAWSNIHREDNPETYAKAQLGLGLAYRTQGKLDDAIAAWSNIHRDDNPETYAQAQLGLGAAYYAQEDWKQTIKTWSNIHRDDNPETYAKVQFIIGNAYEDQVKLDDAITAWSNIHRDDNPETYAGAQLNLGVAYEDQGNLDKAKEAYRNAREFFYYEGERGYRIHECPPEVIKKLRNIAKSTDKVLKSLQIIPDFESQVAHYSRASTAFTLLEKNDPTEGLVLGKYWAQQGISETIHTNDTATFISCFTFNHDSLNQFRLYGKEDGQEATGVSLVFKKEFFRDQSDTLEFIAAPSIDPSSNSGQDSSKEKEKPKSNNNKELIGKSTLYRCIYLDPETGYWTLAQRDKSTFYRQYKGEAKEKWEKYYESIPKKDEIVEKYLFAEDNKNKSVLSILKSISKELEESNAPEESHTYSIEEKQKILEAIRFILLPLQYLVKHIAFREEQECRIMYTTHLHDEKIRHNWEKQWMYVEYEEPVLPHIDKIYLSPGSAKYQDFFRILLDKEDNDDKVRISQNPFRNKE